MVVRFLLNAQRFKDCILGAVVEDQIKAADKLRRNCAEIRRGGDREQNFLCSAVQADLQGVGKLLCFDHGSADTDFAEDRHGTQRRFAKCY